MKKILSLVIILSIICITLGNVSLITYAEDSATVTYNDVVYTKITTSEEFNNISANPTGNYAVMTDNISLTTSLDTFGGTLIGLSDDGSKEQIRTITVNNTNRSGLFEKFENTNNDFVTIKSIKVTGNISLTGTNGYFSGFVTDTSMMLNTTFENCINDVDISVTSTGSSYASAGFVGVTTNRGAAKLNFRNCKNTGDINVIWHAGGYVGVVYYAVSFENCVNSGNISSSNSIRYAGAFIGNDSGKTSEITFDKCYNTGAIDEKSYIGSDDFSNPVKITNCYNADADGYIIRTNNNAAEVRFENCYNASAANKFYESVLNASTTNCYYKSTSTGEEVNGITPLSEDDMKNKDKFIGFDFDEIWIMGESHPEFN